MADIAEQTRWEFLYQEWEYRHRTVWISFNLWGLVVSILICMPFINPDLFEIGWPILAVPMFGLGVCLFANLHLLSEAKRMALIFARFAELRDARPWPHEKPARRLKHRLQALSFGKIIGNLFLYVLAPCCVSSIIVQSIILFDRFGSPFDFSTDGYARFALLLLAVGFPAAGAWIGLHRALKAEERKSRATQQSAGK